LYGDEEEEREIAHRYWIGKYPVTYSQYERFIEDGGYHREDLWSREGWAWREEKDREQPGYWDSTDFNNPIFPVVGVSWYEAQAYCNWVTEKLQVSSCEFQVWRGGQLETPDLEPEALSARLPTEEEWERAARGTDGREYPWGDAFDFSKANIAEKIFEGIGTTSICTYPQGASPVGALGMSGNVWEWTGSLYEPDSGKFVMRGGSWYFIQRHARCAARSRRSPGLFSNYIGLRGVVSLVNSES
jgi:formylglycine-generating enzyme required for sulfatase activity